MMKKLLVMLLALAMICTTFVACGNKSSYEDLVIVDLGLEKEYFGIAFRAGSDMTRKVEDITLQLIEDGTLGELSTKYEVGAVGKGEYTPKADACADSDDWAYIKDKGTLVVGITDYKPMDYLDENGEWIGFDAEYARAVAAKLGVKVEFKEIDWDFKLASLEAKEIDCIWNGMTITEGIEAAADCTAPYMYNTQVAVVKKENADKYKAIADFKGVAIAAEGGSAGETVIKENADLKDGLKTVTAQTDALLEVLSGASEAAIVDLTLAKALIG
ncbi:MAG: transporter substrate-binding domain-containing protein [Ruminococcaceae bacterium]|nr:transporter substrate-binding domain-containing protein [Oscillospiraceae bacterium]